MQCHNCIRRLRKSKASSLDSIGLQACPYDILDCTDLNLSLWKDRISPIRAEAIHSHMVKVTWTSISGCFGPTILNSWPMQVSLSRFMHKMRRPVLSPRFVLLSCRQQTWQLSIVLWVTTSCGSLRACLKYLRGIRSTLPQPVGRKLCELVTSRRAGLLSYSSQLDAYSVRVGRGR